METVSKKKRGRPSVYYRQYGDDQTMRAAFAQMNDNESKRSKVDDIYYMEAFSLLNRHLGEGTFKELFFTPNTQKSRWRCVLVQIGRMRLQNNYTEESCCKIADAAIEFLKKGYTVRQVEKWIRQGRNTNEW